MPSNYPPAFSENSISSTIGQINDFSGSDLQSSSSELAKKTLAAPGDGSSVPVVITGSRSPTQVHFPGLRETMIASAIYQLSEELPPENPVKERIKALAVELQQFGAKKILANPPPVRGGKKGRKN